ncbi:MAG: ribulose bisophosphate carboxylase, ribulose-bisphosphate carboxylase large chain [candidate division WS6 bacterium GW2011_GWF1_33_233]|nr:MAG: ribulose bisophosphate carboxylase, ribulose-bisphosphate carboxylase large chain [candidate division WS6 bacterium GW2011_GWF1_33_233]
MAVQLNYIAPKGWEPPMDGRDYLITYLDIELADGIPDEKFRDAAASCAAESSTGTWTKVYAGKDSGIKMAEKMKAVAYDLNPEKKTFKIAYRSDLFEEGNMAGLLAGVAGNIDSMKMLKAFRLIDIKFPKNIVNSLAKSR